MITQQSHILKGANSQLFALDIRHDTKNSSKGTIIFCHGFKGFKDWGCWNNIAQEFAHNGFAFVKFNFSHNGVGITELNEFTQLEKFAINTFTKEIEDIKAVEAFIQQQTYLNIKNIYIIGHSKGGVSALLYLANNETTIQKVCTWASPFDFYKYWSPSFIQKWRTEGIQYIMNARTKQSMPLDLYILNDFENNKEKYSLENASAKMQLPYLIIHGTADESVKVDDAHLFKKHFTNANLYLIPNANHVFGASHPCVKKELPQHTKELINTTINFFE